MIKIKTQKTISLTETLIFLKSILQRLETGHSVFLLFNNFLCFNKAIYYVYLITETFSHQRVRYSCYFDNLVFKRELLTCVFSLNAIISCFTLATWKGIEFPLKIIFSSINVSLDKIRSPHVYYFLRCRESKFKFC